MRENSTDTNRGFAMTSAPWILILIALVFLVASAMGRLPLWPAVLCLLLERVVTLYPLRF
jgi:hypothetical protein